VVAVQEKERQVAQIRLDQQLSSALLVAVVATLSCRAFGCLPGKYFPGAKRDVPWACDGL